MIDSQGDLPADNKRTQKRYDDDDDFNNNNCIEDLSLKKFNVGGFML